MKIAVEGCCHGELDKIYESVARLEARNKYKVDVLLICGDFQAVRNYQDLECMAVPDKYKELRQFYKYYTGKATAPVLTIVIGGNHEASNYMWELYHGGWLAPNIYFLGHAGCIQVNGIRIAGASGIFKEHDFCLGHYEQLPYDRGAIRSIYHTREYNIRRLSLLSSPRIFMSHDWPQSITFYGNLPCLLKRKKHLGSDIRNNTLGSPPLMALLRALKPEWWFSAHLHTRFEATVVHDEQPAPSFVANPDEIVIEDDEFDVGDDKGPSQGVSNQEQAPTTVAFRNPDEIVMEEEEDNTEPPPVPSPYSRTNFLSLDKCLPNRQFLEVIDLPIPNEPSATDGNKGRDVILSYDPEWLAITRGLHPWLSTKRQQPPLPAESVARSMLATELEWVRENIVTDKNGRIPVLDHQTFVPTAPGPAGPKGTGRHAQPRSYTNPQTEAFCRMLGIENKINPSSAPAPSTTVQEPAERGSTDA